MLRVLFVGTSVLALATAVPALSQESVGAAESVPANESAAAQDDINSVSEDDLYRAVFGKDRPELGPSRYQVMVDGVLSGDALIEPSQEGWVETSFLEKNVFPYLLPEAASALQERISGDRVNFSTLRSLSYDISFNSRDLLLTIAIPMELRTERTIVLRGLRNQSNLNSIEIADFSGFLSVRAGAEWIQTGPLASDSPSGLNIDFDGAVNIMGVVLEGTVRYAETSRRNWIREDVRLVYDDVDSLVRYQLGDLLVGTRPEQNAPRMAGFGAHREFRINPYNDPRPSGERGLVLDRPAQVEVVVNGASVRTLNLAPGRYSITDFPIMPGAINDVEFIVTYATGEVEYVSFPAFLNIELLDEGLSEFSFNIGVPYEIVDQVREYDTGDFNLIGFYRRGMSQNLTLGATVEASSDLANFGPQVAWASPFGNFDVSLVTDMMNPGVDTSRMILRHAWRGTNPDEDPEIDSFVVLTGKDYRTLDRLFDSTVSTVFAQTRFSYPLDRDTRIQVGGSYEKVVDERMGDRWTAGIAASRRFGPLTLIGNFDWIKDQTGENFSARISAFFLFGRTTVHSSYASRNNAIRSEIRRPAGFGVGSFGYAAGFEYNDDSNRQYARLNYVGNRFEGALQQERLDGRGPADMRTGFALGSALVMADGQFALTRPVDNSFAIVTNESSVDADIAVEPRSAAASGVRYSGLSDWAGPAVVPDLPAYLFRDLEVEAPDAPAGSGVGGEVFTVQPRYKSGFLLKSGEGTGSVSALGNLVDSRGSPISFAVGTVFRSGEGGEAEAEDSSTLFTNSSGRFFVEGLEPGVSYQIVMDVAGESVRFDFQTPEDALGIWRIERDIVLDVVLETQDEK